MRATIHTVLPIALAIILPGLSIYTYESEQFTGTFGYLGIWLIVSTFLYFFWNFLWQLWDLRKGNKKWIVFLILAILAAAAFRIYFPIAVVEERELGFQYFVRSILAAIVMLAIQYALKAQENISQLRVEKEQIQTENYKVQLRAIRNQIDPHFLFNSLNTLRSMVRQHHEKSEQFVISLSQFYRQTLKHNENVTLKLSEELEVLESYLFVMKSRNEEAIDVYIDIDNPLHQLHIPTLALQMVVENCFKHNSMSSKKPLKVEIQNADDQYIQVRNPLQPKLGNPEPSGQGLEMLRKRYELMGVEDGLVVEKSERDFVVKLKLIE